MEWDKDSIKAFRKKLGLTQTQFASLLGTSRVLISCWEKGKKKPCGLSKKFLSIIAEKEGVSLVGEGKS